MAVLPIRITGDPILHAKALPVTEFDETLRTLVADMVETMTAAPGVGLAAPQVGVGLRVFVYDWRNEDTEWSGTAINPELWITPTAVGELDEEAEAEGCLSIPGERFPLRRAGSAILRAIDLDQKPFEVHAEGWLARILQHEFDHLNGILFADRLDHENAKRAAKSVKKNGWGMSELSWIPGIDHLEGY